MIKRFNNFINEKNIISYSNKEYLPSDILRMKYIESFFDETLKNNKHNIEKPSYRKLIDSWDGYDDLVYIQNDLENNRFIFYEGWNNSCWNGLYSKPEYNGLNKTEAIEKVINERFSKIGDYFDYIIDEYKYFKYNGYYIIVVFFIKNNKNI